MSDPSAIFGFMSTSLTDLDYRVTTLEDLFNQQMHPKIKAMNWAIGQVHSSTEATRADIRDVYSALGETQVRIASLEGTVRSRTSELRHDLSTLETSVRSDIRAFREDVNRRFEESGARMDLRFESVNEQFRQSAERFNAIDERFERVDERFNAIDERFERIDGRLDRMDTKLDDVLAAIRSGQAGGR